MAQMIFLDQKLNGLYKGHLAIFSSFLPFQLEKSPNSLPRIFNLLPQIVSTSTLECFKAYYMFRYHRNHSRITRKGAYGPRSSWTVNSILGAKVPPTLPLCLETSMEPFPNGYSS